MILDDVLSSSPCNSACLVASIYEIVVDIRNLLASGISCPLLWFFFGCILPLMMASAIALLVCRGVGGCLCPNSSSIILMYTTSCAMMYSPASFASVANDMTF